jgi:hypothetical protein
MNALNEITRWVGAMKREREGENEGERERGREGRRDGRGEFSEVTTKKVINEYESVQI